MRTAAVLIVAAITASPAWARPRPVPIPEVIVDAGQCRTHLAGDRRAACIDCTRKRGEFHPQGIKGPGVCRPRPAPPPAPAAAGRHWLVRPDECNLIKRRNKRRRCEQCVSAGNRYITQDDGWGYCKVKPGQPSPIWLARPERCSSIEHMAKRRRCEQCVRDGHRYLPQGEGWGYCKRKPAVAPPPPTPPTPPPPPREPARTTAGSVNECNTSDLPPPMKRRCVQCVRKGHHFALDGSGRCRAAQPTPPAPPPPPREGAKATAGSIDECNTSDLPRPMKRRCVQCVRKGQRFALDGSGRCRAAPPPPPPPPHHRKAARAASIDECNTSDLPPPMKRRCLKCVRKGQHFALDGSGRCAAAPPPPPHRKGAPTPPPPPHRPGIATNVEQCDSALPGPRRRRCHECVEKGGTYTLAGKGSCQHARRRHR